MRQIALCTIAMAFLFAFQATAAHAQNRVFVAAQGSDSNPCTFAQPCRTFQHAHNVVAYGGEIDVLDPAGYGPVTVTKAISIQGHDFSGISSPGRRRCHHRNAGAGDIVSLRGLIIEGAFYGGNGIKFSSGGSLVVENCVVRNHSGDGFVFLPTGESSLTMSNTVLADNRSNGIYIQPAGSANVTAVLSRVEVYN